MSQSRLPPRALPWPGRVIPTEDERKNGWTEESLALYLAEQHTHTQDMINPSPEEQKRRKLRAWPIETAASRNPFNW